MNDTKEMNLDHPVFEQFKRKIDDALVMAISKADGSNTVTISAKLVIEDLVEEFGTKRILPPDYQVRVSTKTDILNDKDKLCAFSAGFDSDGILMGYGTGSDQISFEDISVEISRPEQPEDE